MATKGDSYTAKGNGVRFNGKTGEWQVLYRTKGQYGGFGPIRVMGGFTDRDEAIKLLDKMEADGFAA